MILFLIATLLACQKQPNKSVSPEELQREILAATAYFAVEIIRADGVIDQKERQLVSTGAFRGVDPIAYDDMNRDKALQRLAILPSNVRTELSAFYQMLASIDGSTHPEESFLLGDFESAKANSEEAEAALAALALRSRRSEAPDMLLRIQIGQEKRIKEQKSYVSASMYPPLSGGKIRLWVDADSGHFNDLDFPKPKEVRGSYWIDLTEKSYRAVGVIDADADGEYATYIASPGAPPKAITSEEVY